MNSSRIEKKAINALECYLEDSSLIDSKITSNDKEMSWDGNLYVYSIEDIAKKNFLCRIPVQIKGKTLNRFKDEFSYPIETSDLKAYLTEGVLYFVIQITPKDKRIFYSDLYPLTIKDLLKGHSKQKTITVKMHRLSMPIAEFEQFLIRFNKDCKKQIAAAVGNAKSFKIEDLQKQNIRKFNVTIPRQDNAIKLFSYLSTHPTFLYAEIQEGVEWPIGDMPITMNFSKVVNQSVKVGDQTYFESIRSTIKGNNMIIEIGDGIMELSYNIEKQQFENIVRFHQKATTLKNSILEAEFILALMEQQQISIGSIDLNISPNNEDLCNYYKDMLPNWRNLAKALNKIGYDGDLAINDISDTDTKTINILIDAMLKAQYYDLKDVGSGLVNLEFMNHNFLIWVARREDGKCVIGNAFDGSVQLQCHVTDDVPVPATIYSYLSSAKLWEVCDNIDYGGMIAAYGGLPRNEHVVFEMANTDVLEMIKVADKLAENNTKKLQLLDAAQRLTVWLGENDKITDSPYAYKLNDMQIRKRKNGLTSDDKRILNSYIMDSTLQPFIKAGAALLLENQEMFGLLYFQMTDEERKVFDDFPINRWREN